MATYIISRQSTIKEMESFGLHVLERRNFIINGASVELQSISPPFLPISLTCANVL